MSVEGLRASWIWTGDGLRPLHRFVCFRRRFSVTGPVANARLRITADARYDVYLDCAWVGHGPPRSDLSPWPVDEYEVTAGLCAGEHALAVLVQHPGLGTAQLMPADPGLLADLAWTDAQGDRTVSTDGTWRCRSHEGYLFPVPVSSSAFGWEEQFDARTPLCAPVDWRDARFDDSAWPAAAVARRLGAPPHETLEPRDIPLLQRTLLPPARVLAVETVRPAGVHASLLLRPSVNAENLTSDFCYARLLVAAFIHSPRDQDVVVEQPHELSVWPDCAWKLNGAPVGSGNLTRYDDPEMNWGGRTAHTVRLRAGWNTLMGRLPECQVVPRAVISMHTQAPLEFSDRPGPRRGPTGWLVLGPFRGLGETEERALRNAGQGIVPRAVEPSASPEEFERLWASGRLTDEDLALPFVRALPADQLCGADTFAVCHSERPAAGRTPRVESPDALLEEHGGWTVVHPDPEGDVRLLLDFGDEFSGYVAFEADAAAGTAIDGHGFEFIQPDGRFNLCEGMNNTFRYICREGAQSHTTVLRRGLRYLWLSIRGAARPVRLRNVRFVEFVYPQKAAGRFESSDDLLNRIWRAGARSVRCCSEDTYVDCPTFEQILYAGDGRNEALVDLVANGDPRLSAHCLRLFGRGLIHGPMVRACGPNTGIPFLPAWSFLWMRWCHEHYWLTGDEAVGRECLAYVERQVRGIEQELLNADGLFEMKAWNMFDWAPMDTPWDGVVTHNNCQLVRALRQVAELAGWLGRADLAGQWGALADRIAAAVNRHFWSEERQAYVDCRHADGGLSDVFSQQTQTAAYAAGVAAGERGRRCRAIMNEAPDGFVRAGSPFFMFFVLEVLSREGEIDRLLATIRDYWGRQIRAGATTFWEMYTPERDRLTRSHCHGWSAAPTFFLSQYVLGLRPAEPGYRTVLIAPRPGDLTEARGAVPTPFGPVTCRWSMERGRFHLTAALPRELPVRLDLPIEGEVAMRRGNLKPAGPDRPWIWEGIARDVEVTVT